MKTKTWRLGRGVVVQWDGAEYWYGVPGVLMNRLASMTDEFQRSILARIGK